MRHAAGGKERIQSAPRASGWDALCCMMRVMTYMQDLRLCLIKEIPSWLIPHKLRSAQAVLLIKTGVKYEYSSNPVGCLKAVP